MTSPIELDDLECEFKNDVLERVPDALLDLCMTCGTCTGGCPASGLMDMDPRKMLRMVNLGMDEEVKKRAWEPYFTTKEVGKGSGLGLSAVFGIIRNHGGQVLIESELGIGTTVAIYLPAHLPPKNFPEGKESTTTTSVLPIIGGAGAILLADDNETVLKQVGRWLSDLGFTVLYAKNGSEAVQKFMDNQKIIRFVVLDLFMPKLGGKEVLRKLRQLDPAVKILVMSGYVDQEDIVNLISHQGTAFIKKPLTFDTFSQAIAKLFPTE